MSGAPAPRVVWATRLAVVLVALLGGTLLAGPGAWSTTTGYPEEQVALGRQVYATACTSCHGADGLGVEGKGPTLAGEGPASVDFVMRTGRMPLSDPDLQALPGPDRYEDEEILGLVAYVDVLTGGDGPRIPDPDVAGGDVPVGGELFRTYCASCHQAAGQGGALTEAIIPSLSDSTPSEVASAMLIGPGTMPAFSDLSSEEVDDITAYVAAIQDLGDPGGFGIGRTGPFAEGLVAWGVGLVALVLVARWIGTRMA